MRDGAGRIFETGGKESPIAERGVRVTVMRGVERRSKQWGAGRGMWKGGGSRRQKDIELC